MKKDKNNDENIVLDEQQKENEQSQKELHKSKVKRIVLAVLLLILAVAFVVLGAFCVSGVFDRVSAPANVAYADCIVDDVGADDSIFNVNARKYFGDESDNKTPVFNAFAIGDGFFSWFDDWGVPYCNRQSFFTFNRVSDDKRVADLLVSRSGNYAGGLILRMFADDKQSSYSSYDMFSFSDVFDDNSVLRDMFVRTFMNTFCFGYGVDDVVYGKLNDDVVDEIWAREFTEMMWLCCDVTNQSKINQLQSSIDYWELNYNALCDNYNKLDDEYSKLVKDYNNLECDYFDLQQSNCISYVPYYISSGTYGERVYIDINDEVDKNVLVVRYKSKIFPTDIRSMSDIEPDLNGFAYMSYEELCRVTVNNFQRNQTWYYLDDEGYYYFQIIAYDRNHELYTEDFQNTYILTDVKLPCGLDMGWGYGYGKGYNLGQTYALEDTDNVTNGIIEVIESPIEFLKTIFNFEIFGINISSVIFFVISILIVAFVIRKVV